MYEEGLRTEWLVDGQAQSCSYCCWLSLSLSVSLPPSLLPTLSPHQHNTITGAGALSVSGHQNIVNTTLTVSQANSQHLSRDIAHTTVNYVVRDSKDNHQGKSVT